jgi:hypothetical protein
MAVAFVTVLSVGFALNQSVMSDEMPKKHRDCILILQPRIQYRKLFKQAN